MDVRARGLELVDELRKFDMVAPEDCGERRRAWRLGEPRVQRSLSVSRVRKELMRDRVDRVIKPLT